MKLGLGQMHEATDERLKFARQLGVSHIIIHTPPLRGDGYWELLDLLQLKNHIESYGLELAAIENLPRDHYDNLLLGAPGRTGRKWGDSGHPGPEAQGRRSSRSTLCFAIGPPSKSPPSKS